LRYSAAQNETLEKKRAAGSKDIDVDSARFVDLNVADAADVQSNFHDTLPDCGVDQCELVGLQRVRADSSRRRAVRRHLSNAAIVGGELRLTDDQVNAVVAGFEADAGIRRGKMRVDPLAADDAVVSTSTTTTLAPATGSAATPSRKTSSSSKRANPSANDDDGDDDHTKHSSAKGSQAAATASTSDSAKKAKPTTLDPRVAEFVQYLYGETTSALTSVVKVSTCARVCCACVR
jgi:hypothetical protein